MWSKGFWGLLLLVMRLKKLPAFSPPTWRLSAGKAAQASGKSFEALFETMCNIQQIKYVRIPSGARTVKKGILIREKSPFDCFIEKNGRLLFADLKSTKAGTFPTEKIKDHQIEALSVLKKGGQKSGYIVEFSTRHEIYFFDVATLIKLKILKKSASPAQGVLVGLVGSPSRLLDDELFCQKSEIIHK